MKQRAKTPKPENRYLMGHRNWAPAIAWDDSGRRAVNLMTKSDAMQAQQRWRPGDGPRVVAYELVPVEDR